MNISLIYQRLASLKGQRERKPLIRITTFIANVPLKQQISQFNLK